MIQKGFLKLGFAVFAALFCLSAQSAMASRSDAVAMTKCSKDDSQLISRNDGCSKCGKCEACPKCPTCPEKKKCEACPCPATCDEACPSCDTDCSGCPSNGKPVRKGAAKSAVQGS